MGDLVPSEPRAAVDLSERTPAELLAIANQASALAHQNAGLAIEYALAAKEQVLIAGRALREARGRFAYGEWGPYLDAHWKDTHRLAQYYMRIADPENAKRVSHLPPEASLRQMIAAVSSSPTTDAPETATDEDGGWDSLEQELRDEHGGIVNPALVMHAVRDVLRRDEERQQRRLEHPRQEPEFFDGVLLPIAYVCPKCKYDWVGRRSKSRQ